MLPVHPRFPLEVIKLLLQSAWADQEVSAAEEQAILDQARKLGLPAEQMTMVRECLRGKQRLPPPDMGLLRQHAEEAVAAVRSLLMADLRFSKAEQQILAEIEALLGLGSA